MTTDLKAHEATLRAYARGLAELYDVDRDGDDYWTATSLPDGTVVDVNVWIDGRWKRERLRITAYAIDDNGSTITTNSLSLYEQPLAQRHTSNEGDPFP